MLGELSCFLGFQITQTSKGTFVSQSKYLKEVLKKFGMEECSLVSTPMVTSCKLCKINESPKVDQTFYRSIIGSLLYLIASRPDIMLEVCIVGIFQAAPIWIHLQEAKIILIYLRATMDYGLWYPRGKYFSLIFYTDVDWAGNIDE